MVHKNFISTEPADFSNSAEEIQRKLVSAKDAQLSSEVGQRNETVLSNIMLPSEQSAQIIPLEKTVFASSSVTSETPISLIPDSQNSEGRNNSRNQSTTKSNQDFTEFNATESSAVNAKIEISGIALNQTREAEIQLPKLADLGTAYSSESTHPDPASHAPIPEKEPSNENHTPTVTTLISNQLINEDAGFTFAVPPTSFTDVDVGDPLSYEATQADGSPLPSWLVFDPATQIFSGIPLNEDVGGIAIRVTATDLAGASATQNFHISVANTNDGPVVSAAIADQVANEDAGFTFTLPAGSFTDVDVGDQLSYTTTLIDGGPLPLWLSFDPVKQTFSGIPANGDVGDIAIRVTATDLAGASAAQNFNISVTNTNDGPVITSVDNITVLENISSAVHQVTATDVDVGDTITYSLSGADAALFNIDAGTGAVSFKSSPNYEAPADAGGNNVYDVTVNASDGTNTAAQDVAITVANVNEGPTTIAVTGPQSVQETVTSGGTIGTAYDPGAVQPVVATLTNNDPDAGDTTTYSLVGGTPGLFTVSGNQIKVAAGASFDYETTPSYTLAVRATDSAGNTYDQSIIVNIANYAGTYAGTAGNDTAAGTSEEDTNSGGAGNDTLYGGAGNDVLDGGTGDDTLNGGTGSDTFIGGTGADTVDYSSATSGITLSFAATDGNGVGGQFVNSSAGGYNGEATGDTFSGIEAFVGTTYADAVGGGSVGMTFTLGGGNDLFDTNAAYAVSNIVYGGGGNDTMWTGAGDDSLCGGTGDDYLNGEAGTDTVYYSDVTSGVIVNLSTTAAQNTLGAGTDTIVGIENLHGSTYADTLTGDSGNNSIWGDAGNDTISGAAGNDTIDGGSGDDTILGGAGNDTLTGGAGTDWVSYSDATSAVTANLSTATTQNTGGGGIDTINGFENLQGSAYTDTLVGNGGVNTILGGAGNDSIDGGSGDDLLGGGLGNDVITGGAGTDTATYSDATSAVTVNLTTTNSQNTVGAGTDTLTGVENLYGSAYNDRLTGDNGNNKLWGDAGNDIISGGRGNDTIIGGSGADTLSGNNGADTLSYDTSSTGVTVNLTTNTASGGDATGDAISGFENVVGGSGNDTLTAATAGSTLDGGAGNDALYGGSGNDTFYGGAGNDVMGGGAGADLFFLQAGLGNDTVTGGTGGGWVDAIDLHNASGGSYSGAFPADWALVLTSGSVVSTGTEIMTLSNDSSGYVQHTDGTLVNFTEIEQVRW